MFNDRPIGGFTPGSTMLAIISLTLVAVNLTFSIIANAGFRESATSASFRGFLTWQVIGNLAGFATVITLTALLRFVPLHIAFPVTTGLAVIGVQVVASYAIFNESISRSDWFGTLLIVIGIVFIGHA